MGDLENKLDQTISVLRENEQTITILKENDVHHEKQIAALRRKDAQRELDISMLQQQLQNEKQLVRFLLLMIL